MFQQICHIDLNQSLSKQHEISHCAKMNAWETIQFCLVLL